MARPTLTKHPKFRRLASMLDIPAPHALGLLEFLWAVAYENGEPTIGDTVDVELAAGWTGTPGALCTALATCAGTNRAGFIEPSEDRPDAWQIHDLYHHAPDYVVRRAEREAHRTLKGLSISDVRRAAARSRWAKAKGDRDSSDMQPNANESLLNANGATPAPAPAPAPIEESAERFRPEAASAARGPKSSDFSPVVLTFPVKPTKGHTAKAWDYRQSLHAELVETYSGLDVLFQARKALQWCRTNPTKQKTARGMPAFLNRWMENETNRRGQTATRGNARPADDVTHLADAESEAAALAQWRNLNPQPSGVPR